MTKVKPSGRFVLLAMAGFCLAPVLVACLFYWRAPQMAIYSVGQLLPTQRFAAASLPGWPLGLWALVSVEPSDCIEQCRQRSFALGQIRQAQGEAALRITRVRLLERAAQPERSTEVQLSAPYLVKQLARPGYYLIDPMGNQVMFYADALDPVPVIREVARLIKLNNAL
jgi:hypothetical protein